MHDKQVQEGIADRRDVTNNGDGGGHGVSIREEPIKWSRESSAVQ
jgi:hypothetical protein